MPPLMPFFHDALWFGVFAGLALFAWKMAQRFDLRLSGFDWRQPIGRAGEAVAAAPSAWFTTRSHAPMTRSSGNTAFDDWRDGEIAKIEAQRQTLEARLVAFETFVDKLRRAKDRQTFERFMAEHRDEPVTEVVDHADHRPA